MRRRRLCCYDDRRHFNDDCVDTTTTSVATYILSAPISGSGTVASSPAGIYCTTTCNANFNASTSVTLRATAALGYSFTGWSGACSGTAACTVAMSQARSVTATFAPAVIASGNPYVIYTDIISGPITGGENNQGAYLSIFGKNFGSSGLGTTTKVYIGGVEVASYRALVASKVYDKLGIQQIMVQVGALGGAALGTAIPIKVVVNGVDSNTNVKFMPNPGRMLFVDNVAGNDATAVPGDITQPYRYVQTAALYTGGAWPVAQAGDIMVMRGHGNTNPWIDLGSENYFIRFRNKSGSAPTGALGTGAIALMSYPGEDTYIRGTVAGGMTGGCISAINGQSYPGMGQWVVIALIRQR